MRFKLIYHECGKASSNTGAVAQCSVAKPAVS